MSTNNEHATRLTLLVRLKCSDNNRAWTEFEGIYSPFIYSLIRRMSFRHHDALDISQTVLTKVWQKIDQYEAQQRDGSFRGWLARITQNTVRDFIRTKKNFITTRNAVEYNDLLRSIEDHQLPNIEDLARKEWVFFVTNMAKKNVISTLSENKRAIFEMSVLEKTIKEIAEALDVSESLVYHHRQDVFARMKMEIKRLDSEL